MESKIRVTFKQADTNPPGQHAVDPRHWGAGYLAEDLPPAYPGGRSHKAGTPVTVITVTRDERGIPISFDMPSPVALATSAALKAAVAANDARRSIILQNEDGILGPGKGVPSSNSAVLFDYFEYCMTSIVFSYSAVEMFCNQTIADKLVGTYVHMRRGEAVELSADEVQRQISTDEKVATVLPHILGKSPIKSRSEWADFKSLSKARNSVIHLKSHDAYQRGSTDHHSIFHQMFAKRSVLVYPSTTIGIISLLTDGIEPNWLVAARHAVHNASSGATVR